ncbi:uncharacterized protein KY384_005119 [Bacidia gigantensis]|uniref:uncharacterized protein n=1 Tax=Bacidia gigantensis TaxID=2732470 RepID=UPI001D03CFA5|nr:uncharacterized protein KY384_005119 [Bacidia gigantensis]KAG8529638.1 hypothetical protein KY384_005119 [Bacidia gigantensis]
MLGSVLPFSPELADRVSEYCEKHSEHESAVLEVGTFTGFSALAWYEGTKATQAEIVTLDLPGDMMDKTREFFKEVGVDDRVKSVVGPAVETLKEVESEFDIIFLDADKQNNGTYLEICLEKRLLAGDGVVILDNMFARGLTMGPEFNPHADKSRRPFWEAMGVTIRKLNVSFLEDPRIDVLLLPLFDGVTMIKWKEGYVEGKVNGEGKKAVDGKSKVDGKQDGSGKK